MQENQKQFVVTEDLFASQGQRFLNFIIDVFIQLSFMLVIISVAGNMIGEEAVLKFIKNLEKNQLRLFTVSSCSALIYYNLFEIFFSRTIGKVFTKTVVVDGDGEMPRHETILIRSLCRLIPFFVFSFLRVPTRGWHDRISNTYVVNKRLLEEKKQLFNLGQEKI